MEETIANSNNFFQSGFKNCLIDCLLDIIYYKTFAFANEIAASRGSAPRNDDKRENPISKQALEVFEGNDNQ